MVRTKKDQEMEIMLNIWQTLKADPDLNLNNVKLDMRDGILYVKGEVESHEMKNEIIEMIQRTPFKIQVISHLNVKASKGLIGDFNDRIRMI